MYTELQVISQTAPNLLFYAYKSTRPVTLQDVPLINGTSGRSYAPAKVAILIREYPENYQK